MAIINDPNSNSSSGASSPDEQRSIHLDIEQPFVEQITPPAADEAISVSDVEKFVLSVLDNKDFMDDSILLKSLIIAIQQYNLADSEEKVFGNFLETVIPGAIKKLLSVSNPASRNYDEALYTNFCVKVAGLVIELLIKRLHSESDQMGPGFMRAIQNIFTSETNFSMNCYSKRLNKRQRPLKPKAWSSSRAAFCEDMALHFIKLHGFLAIKAAFCKKNVPYEHISALIHIILNFENEIWPDVIENQIFPIPVFILDTYKSMKPDRLAEILQPKHKHMMFLKSIIHDLKRLITSVPEDKRNEDVEKLLNDFFAVVYIKILHSEMLAAKLDALENLETLCLSQRKAEAFPNASRSRTDRAYLAKLLKLENFVEAAYAASLHISQYVFKTEGVLNFLIYTDSFTPEDLSLIWSKQENEIDSTMKNVQTVICKIAGNFSLELVKHLCSLLENSWKGAKSDKSRYLLTSFVKSVSEKWNTDADGIRKITECLDGLWRALKSNTKVHLDVIDETQDCHVKIIDSVATAQRLHVRKIWLKKFVESMRNNDQPVLAMRHFVLTCKNLDAQKFSQSVFLQQESATRRDIINDLQTKFGLINMVIGSLESYMNDVRKNSEYLKLSSKDDINKYNFNNSLFDHHTEILMRLEFIKFISVEAEFCLSLEQLMKIWEILVSSPTKNVCASNTNGVEASEVEDVGNQVEIKNLSAESDICFNFLTYVCDFNEPLMDPDNIRAFLENQVLKHDPKKLTMNAFESVMKMIKFVNLKEGIFVHMNGEMLTRSLNIIGFDYLWRILVDCDDDLVQHVISVIVSTSANVDLSVINDKYTFHDEVKSRCSEFLRPLVDNLKILIPGDGINSDNCPPECSDYFRKAERIAKLNISYVQRYDNNYPHLRCHPPLKRDHGSNKFSFRIDTNDPDRVILLSCHETMTVRELKHMVAVEMDTDTPFSLNYISEETNTTFYAIDDWRQLEDFFDMWSCYPTNCFKLRISFHNAEANSCKILKVVKEEEEKLPGVIFSKSDEYMDMFKKIFSLGLQVRRDSSIYQLMQFFDQLPAQRSTKSCLFEILYANEKVNLQDVLNGDAAECFYNTQILFSLICPASSHLVNPKSRFFGDLTFNLLNLGGIQSLLNLIASPKFQSLHHCARKRSMLLVLRLLRLLFISDILIQRNCGSACVEHIFDSLVYLQNITDSKKFSLDADLFKIAKNTVPPINEEVLKKMKGRLGSYRACDVAETIKLVNLQCRLSAAGRVDKELCDVDESSFFCAIVDESPIDDLSRCLFVEGVEYILCASAFTSAGFFKTISEESFCLLLNEALLLSPDGWLREFCVWPTIAMAELENSEFSRCLYRQLMSTVALSNNHRARSSQFFKCLRRVIRVLHSDKSWVEPSIMQDIEGEIEWLYKVRDNVRKGKEGVCGSYLYNRMLHFYELLPLIEDGKKLSKIGSDADGWQVLKLMLEDFIFPSAKIILKLRGGDVKSLDSLPYDYVKTFLNPLKEVVCQDDKQIEVALSVVLNLCRTNGKNLEYLTDFLRNMFYPFDTTGSEFLCQKNDVYIRPSNQPTGLKNCGTTCYINSIVQQLYVTPKFRQAMFNLNGMVPKSVEIEDVVNGKYISQFGLDDVPTDAMIGSLQVLCAMLTFNRSTFIDPSFFLHSLRWNKRERVDFRIQEDASEFFYKFQDLFDENLKKLGEKQIMNELFQGGTVTRRISAECEHFSETKDNWTTLAIPITKIGTLYSSLDAFMTCEVIDKWTCEECECFRQVRTTKGFNKLPNNLVIQLNRFEFKFESMQTEKNSDCLEFPFELDMSKYLMKNNENEGTCTNYLLTGVVVHSGMHTNSGHYYSYIRNRCPGADGKEWIKFDDDSVTSVNFNDPTVLRNCCFGGDGSTRVRSPVAYIIFYERVDSMEENNSYDELCDAMPAALRSGILKHSLQLMHSYYENKTVYTKFLKDISDVVANMRIEAKMCEYYSDFLATVVLSPIRSMKGSYGMSKTLEQRFVDLLEFSESARLSLVKKFFFKNEEFLELLRLGERSTSQYDYLGSCNRIFLACMENSVSDEFDEEVLSDTMIGVLAKLIDLKQCDSVADFMMLTYIMPMKENCSDDARTHRFVNDMKGFFHVVSDQNNDYPNVRILMKKHQVLHCAVDFILNERIVVESWKLEFTESLFKFLKHCYCIGKKNLRKLGGDYSIQASEITDDGCYVIDNSEEFYHDILCGKPTEISISTPKIIDRLVPALLNLSWMNPKISLMQIDVVLNALADVEKNDKFVQNWNVLRSFLFTERDSWSEVRFNFVLGVGNKNLPFAGEKPSKNLFDIIAVQKQCTKQYAYLLIRLLVEIMESSEEMVQHLRSNSEFTSLWRNCFQWLQSVAEEVGSNTKWSHRVVYRSDSVPNILSKMSELSNIDSKNDSDDDNLYLSIESNAVGNAIGDEGGDDGLPSYDEAVRNNENRSKRKKEASEENKRSWSEINDSNDENE